MSGRCSTCTEFAARIPRSWSWKMEEGYGGNWSEEIYMCYVVVDEEKKRNEIKFEKKKENSSLVIWTNISWMNYRHFSSPPPPETPIGMSSNSSTTSSCTIHGWEYFSGQERRNLQESNWIIIIIQKIPPQDEEETPRKTRSCTYPLSVAMAVQNCILRNVAAHLCLYSSGTRTIKVVDDWMKHRHDVMTNKTDPAWPEFCVCWEEELLTASRIIVMLNGRQVGAAAAAGDRK